jgi:hypothetical protein
MTSYHAKFILHKHWGISKNETHVPNTFFSLPYDTYWWVPHGKEKKNENYAYVPNEFGGYNNHCN